MKFVTSRSSNPVVPIVSLIDILAILLIFFIFTTTFKKREALVNLSLPQSSELDQATDITERVSLSVTVDEKIALGEQEVSLKDLGAALLEFRQRSPAAKLELRVDEEVPLGFLVQVWDEASGVGVKIGDIPLRILLKQGKAQGK